MRLLLALIFSFVTTFAVGGEDERYVELFELGNNSYEQGAYDSATLYYSQILNAGYESSQLLFNLGNAYFKSGQLGAAIYFYERASKMAPNNPDILFNLKMANSQITDKIESVPKPLLTSFLEWIRNLFSTDGWGWFTVLSFIIGLICLGTYLFTDSINIKKISFFSFIILIGLSLFAGSFGYVSLCAVSDEDEAIVFAASLSVKAEPKPSSSDLFVIHEGTKVALIEKTDEWCRVSLPDGNEGWVPLKEIKTY